jgi:hypothetical protein
MIPEGTWERVWARLERAFGETANEVKRSVHDLSWECGRSANDVFPLRAYATFRQGSKVVDLSVDCKLSHIYLLISADLAREEGFVLSDMPVRSVNLTTDFASVSTEIDAAIAQAERFALDQISVICQAIRMP